MNGCPHFPSFPPFPLPSPPLPLLILDCSCPYSFSCSYVIPTLLTLYLSGAALSLLSVARRFLGTRRVVTYVVRRCPCIASSLLRRHRRTARGAPPARPRASGYLTRMCFTLSPEVRPVCILFCSAHAVAPCVNFLHGVRRTSLFPSLLPAS